MSKLLLLYGYNNYFNRIMRRESTLAEYKTKVGTGFYVELDSTNFNVTDGVNARHIFNVSSFLDDKSPDYLVREVTKTIGGQTTTKLERWFVLESVKIMGNQVQLSLRRDMIADYYDEIKVAPAYIQKAMLPYDSPLIFNKEGLTFNEIKTKEYLIKDSTKCSWIVGYLARSLNEQEHDPCIGKTEIIPTSLQIVDYEDLPNKIKTIISQGSARTVKNTTLSFNAHFQNNFLARLIKIVEDNDVNVYKTGAHDDWAVPIGIRNIDENNFNIDSFLLPYIQSGFLSFFQQETGSLNENEFNTYNEKLIKRVISGREKYFRLVFNRQNDLMVNYSASTSDLLISSFGLKCNTFINNVINSSPTYFINETTAHTGKLFNADVILNNYSVELIEEDLSDVSVEIGTNRNSLYDAPYDIFAIPMGDNITVTKTGSGGFSFNVKGNVALPLARGIKIEFGSSCYDIQILPFCPFKDMFLENTEEMDITGFTEGKDYALVKNEEDENVNIVIFPHRSSGSYDVDVSNIEEFNISENFLERKIAAETIKARIVSPNYSGSFDFNPQKNNGVGLINVDYNCKPYTPYIHVSPVFAGLYGIDTNDARGLICGGDFSITVAASQWEEYQIQNKNFENIFDRQIQNMDVNNSIAMEKAKYTATIGAISSGVQGATGGAITGSMLGGPVAGAVIGGLTSTALSAAAGLKDVELLGRQQSENRDYAVDMYTYQLGNIQALPYTLTKVSTYNENNKIFPFIEIYDCTDVEKQNLRDKIKYNGMTVMVEGKIEDYVFNEGDYIQAQLIRLEGIYEDNHMIVEIYNELMKGIYIYG